MSAPKLDSFPLGLPATPFYTGLATAVTAALAFVLYRQRTSTSSKSSKTQSGKMPPPVGSVKVSKILVHPIKAAGEMTEYITGAAADAVHCLKMQSCRGTSVLSAKYSPQGLENDRMWCVIDAEKNQILTAREVAKLVLITPRIEVDETSAEGGSLVVSFPEDSGCDGFTVPLRPSDETLRTWTVLPHVTLWATHDPIDGYICQSSVKGAPSPSDILSKYIEKPIHLIYKGPRPRPIDPTHEYPNLKATAHYQDMYPMLVCSEENAQAVEEQIRPLVGTQGIDQQWKDGKILIERFRPNIVFRGGGAFSEDDWEEIGLGSEDAPTITLVSKCTRCLLPNVDPETGTRDKAVPYKVIMKFRKGIDPVEKMKPCIGCNGVPESGGIVRVGDVVYVKKMYQ